MPPSTARVVCLVEARLPATRSAMYSVVAGRPYGGSEANTIRSAGTRANSSITSSGKKHEMSYRTPGCSARRVVRIPWSQIAPWARISTAPGWRSARSTSPSASGGSPRPAWIRIGTRASSASVEDLVHLAPVEDKVLRARVQLDAARARRQAAFGLREWPSAGSRRQNGTSRALAFRRPREHAVVGHAVGRLALGVVQWEHARAARAGAVELGEQLCQRQRTSILVQP